MSGGAALRKACGVAQVSLLNAAREVMHSAQKTQKPNETYVITYVLCSKLGSCNS